jgi:hypothetical protein
MWIWPEIDYVPLYELTTTLTRSRPAGTVIEMPASEGNLLITMGLVRRVGDETPPADGNSKLKEPEQRNVGDR